MCDMERGLLPGMILPPCRQDKEGSCPETCSKFQIVDLSWPLGLSVNWGIDKHLYLGTYFSLHLPSIDHITDQLKLLGKGCDLYKMDKLRAFRHIKVDPMDYDIFGLA